MYPEWLQWYVLWFAALQFQHESQWLELYLRAGCGTEGFLFYPDRRILRKKREYGHVLQVSRIALPLTESGRSFTARSVTMQFSVDVLTPLPVSNLIERNNPTF